MTTKTHSTKDKNHDFQEIGELARNIAQEKLEDWQASAYEYVEEGQERIEDFSKALKKSIRAKPLKSVCLAALAGVVFGRFCMRR